MDIIKVDSFSNNIVAGLATGSVKNKKQLSFYKTYSYSQKDVVFARNLFENHIQSKYLKKFKYIYQNQNHTDIIQYIGPKSKIISSISDALITNCKNIILNVSIADCAALLIYEKNIEIIAAVHSGWRGTKMNIIGKTIDRMNIEFNAKPVDMAIQILPLASVNCYEVGEEFLDYFPNSTIKSKGKIYFDNQKEIINQLKRCDISESNISINNDCTILNKRFHSHRRDGVKAGRMNAFIGIKG